MLGYLGAPPQANAAEAASKIVASPAVQKVEELSHRLSIPTILAFLLI